MPNLTAKIASVENTACLQLEEAEGTAPSYLGVRQVVKTMPSLSQTELFRIDAVPSNSMPPTVLPLDMYTRSRKASSKGH